MTDLGLPFSARAFVRVALWTAVWPLLAVLGVAVLLAATAGGLAKIIRLRTVGRETLRCPAGHPNGTVGRWECGRCGGQFAGWVGKCSVCGDESADWFGCAACGLAVPLPWRPPR